MLGGYTTFSSYQLDTANLYNKRKRGLAFYWIGVGGSRSNRGRARRADTAAYQYENSLLEHRLASSLSEQRGCYGSAVRELLMLRVANLPGGFPMSIFIANMTAALLIGVLSALTIRGGVIGSGGELLLTTGAPSFMWC